MDNKRKDSRQTAVLFHDYTGVTFPSDIAPQTSGSWKKEMNTVRRGNKAGGIGFGKTFHPTPERP